MAQVEDKLRDSDIRFIEKLLYEQKSHESAIAELEAQIRDIYARLTVIGSTSVVDMSKPKVQSEFTQPESFVSRQEQDNLRIKYLRGRIAERERHQATINAALDSMNEEENEFINLRYNLEKPHSYVAKKLKLWDRKEHLPLSTYWRLRRRILEKVAVFLGLL